MNVVNQAGLAVTPDVDRVITSGFRAKLSPPVSTGPKRNELERIHPWRVEKPRPLNFLLLFFYFNFFLLWIWFFFFRIYSNRSEPKGQVLDFWFYLAPADQYRNPSVAIESVTPP
jgi:hypothetical protein